VCVCVCVRESCSSPTDTPDRLLVLTAFSRTPSSSFVSYIIVCMRLYIRIVLLIHRGHSTSLILFHIRIYTSRASSLPLIYCIQPLSHGLRRYKHTRACTMCTIRTSSFRFIIRLFPQSIRRVQHTRTRARAQREREITLSRLRDLRRNTCARDIFHPPITYSTCPAHPINGETCVY